MSGLSHLEGCPGARPVWARSTPHTTVQAWMTDGRTVFTKQHRDPARLAREAAALETWAATLGQSPRVQARHDDHLVLSALPGEHHTADSLPLAAWTAAGAWLRRAHQLPDVPPDPLPVDQALRRRLKGLVRRARRVLPPELVVRCRDTIGDPGQLATPRVWCHRDFTPDNWLWEPATEQLWVLDFEHARPDIAWSDRVKLAATAFVERPEAQGAFDAGYGPLPHPTHARAHVVWHGLATLTWGLQHGAADFVRLGRDILQHQGLHAADPLPETPRLPRAR